jgi:hypothetical protein
MSDAFSNPATRRYIYRVAMAVMALLAVVHALDASLLSAIEVVIAAILGLADVNVPKSEE